MAKATSDAAEYYTQGRQAPEISRRKREMVKNKTTYFSTAIAASSKSSSWQYILSARSNS